DNTDYHVQAYFSYDSKKSGGSTVSHLRFSKKPIKSPYLVYSADYIACHNKSFVNHIDVLKGIKENGIFVLNCDWKEEELEKFLPDSMKREIASKNISFYIVDAISIAGEIGLGNRINMIMQTIFFKLINIIPIEDAVKLLKESIEHAYGKKGQKIVEMNYMAVDNALEGLVKVNVPKSWSSIDVKKREVRFGNDFVDRIQIPMARHEGDELLVSAFLGMEDGSFPSGTTKYEKRGIAVLIPQWIKENCIECGMCSFVCPHATIRLFLLDDEEKKRAPLSFKTREVESKGDKYYLRVQVSPLDCTGCGNCADICPPKDKALVMKPMESLLEEYNENWEYAVSVKPKEPIFPVNTIKGSQYMVPYLEFSGACPGCGETPYVRLVTQLFGNRMLIANATGCSSIWGASAPSMSYSKDAEGRGPAWANSLFEDNAEFGFGMYLAIAQKRERLYRLMQTAKQENIPDDLRTLFEEWIKNRDDGNSTLSIARKIKEYFNRNPKVLENRLAAEIKKDEDYLVKKSVWIIGGDGWAYDIGYGGLDHVLASGADVNILVLDTEIYSNTGGQASKSTPASAVAKFAAGGKKTRKKDLGFMAISYGDVYVAQISMGANMNHTLKTILEAESYNGPSLIIAYAPCISHGIKTGMGTSIRQEKRAVEAGYWHLYRYDPRLKEEGKNPFILDSRDPKESYQDFLQSEIRYTQLANVFPEASKKLYELSEKYANERLERYKKLK
ncbi:MAG: pyruvate:ferredoxin (flavodoxin) oxidoreductase, partial [Clostridiaceae bacterium]|nr:pyruvate:ferredoxin (flavodoxin) oxidoreductase [Clostridiaceae bacterium]